MEKKQSHLTECIDQTTMEGSSRLVTADKKNCYLTKIMCVTNSLNDGNNNDDFPLNNTTCLEVGQVGYVSKPGVLPSIGEFTNKYASGENDCTIPSQQFEGKLGMVVGANGLGHKEVQNSTTMSRELNKETYTEAWRHMDRDGSCARSLDKETVSNRASPRGNLTRISNDVHRLISGCSNNNSSPIHHSVPSKTVGICSPMIIRDCLPTTTCCSTENNTNFNIHVRIVNNNLPCDNPEFYNSNNHRGEPAEKHSMEEMMTGNENTKGKKSVGVVAPVTFQSQVSSASMVSQGLEYLFQNPRKSSSQEMKDDRPFVCQTCGNKFRQQSHLQQHIRIHTNHRPYKCRFCEKAFKQKSQVMYF